MTMKVNLLIRARSVDQEKERIIAAATFVGWWQEEYADCVNVWLGDLKKPHLGLVGDKWCRLSGTAGSPDCIDSIIHNRAG